MISIDKQMIYFFPLHIFLYRFIKLKADVFPKK
jgi:hypothetical protein